MGHKVVQGRVLGVQGGGGAKLSQGPALTMGTLAARSSFLTHVTALTASPRNSLTAFLPAISEEAVDPGAP